MSDARTNKLDDRLREVEKVLFNGLNDASRKMNDWLDDQAPALMTREEHERLDEARWVKSTERNREIGRKKDRTIKLIAVALPVATVAVTKLADLLL
jgi:hypothetical protein